jgi:hypothetical protein
VSASFGSAVKTIIDIRVSARLERRIVPPKDPALASFSGAIMELANEQALVQIVQAPQETNEVKLNSLRDKRDQLRTKRDAYRRDTPEWTALNEKFREAKFEYQRVYDRQAKRQQRTREAEQAAVAAETQEKDPFTVWFSERTLPERREFCLVHPGFLKTSFPRHLSNALKLAAAAMCKDIVKNFGFTEAEAAEEALSIISEDLAKNFYGMSIIEVNAILDGGYHPEPLQFAKPRTVFDGMEWLNVDAHICNVSHVLVPVGTTRAEYEDHIKRAKQRAQSAPI